MVATERKSFWSPHPLIRYICVSPMNNRSPDAKKPPPG
jgi:hypothetical protein